MANFMGRSLFPASPKKRQPRFAGQWYEADAAKLRLQLEQFMQRVDRIPVEKTDDVIDENPSIDGCVLAIVSPHAGYIFSGQTAAFAFDSVKGRKIDRVFLLGPSHYVGFHGAALPTENVFVTPLGELQLDRRVIDELARYPLFEESSEVHKREHSLEMQLAFIKLAPNMEDAKIVPIAIGTLADAAEVRLVSRLLLGYIEKNDLVIVSSDFTHFGPRYGYQPFREDIQKSIKKLDGQAFQHLSKCDLDGFLDFHHTTGDTICGLYPCAVLLGMLPEGSRGTLLNYRTSRDSILEDEQNSVTYMALAFSSAADNGWPVSDAAGSLDVESVLSEEDKSILLKVARQTVEFFAKHKKTPTLRDLNLKATSKVLEENFGTFVTLFKRPDQSKTEHDRELRGCIGYIWPIKPLLQAVIENAVGACSRDYRFRPVESSEVKQLQIEINVLTPPHKVSSLSEITLGKDGIIMYLKGRQSVFLPHVAVEFGWDLDETLAQLAIKAGFGPNEWKDAASFDVFRASAFEEELF